MFTDIVGFTNATQANESAALRLLKEQEDLVRPLLTLHEDREVKSTGDGFLVEFESALRAVECAIHVQKQLLERNSQPGVAPIQLRIGIHLGDGERRGHDIFGDSVNLAARIVPLADPPASASRSRSSSRSRTSFRTGSRSSPRRD
jgi:adenylate cyclase